MFRERVESMQEENRKLASESILLTRGQENSKAFIDMLENEKLRLETELLRYSAKGRQSNIVEAELH